MTIAKTDPRPREEGEADIRPVVARGRRELPIWLLSGIAVLGAVLLFSALDARRRTVTAPTTSPRIVDAAPMPSALPPLYIPPELAVPPPPPFYAPTPTASFQAAPRSVLPARPLMPPGFPAISPPLTIMPPPATPFPEPIRSSGEVLIFDGTASPEGNDAATGLATATGNTEASTTQPVGAGTSAQDGRARAMRLRQLATTVPQGTLIPAVLETALDSTRLGHVRAVVSRDVRGFDGSRILIPRGTRLFGEYRIDFSPGQNRAFVRWTRLVRPDGVAIAIDSPAADALGRAGIQGRVNSHFLERFGAAVLQSTLSLGVALAGRSIGDTPVIVALPGSTPSLVTPAAGQQVQPTLHVDAGVSVTVFVARDLNFPWAEALQ